MFIDPRHLEQLAAIVDHATLSEAATQLGTTQPALSRMLGNLEARVGVALFEREKRPFAPTEIGRKLADQGRAIKAARTRAAEEVQLESRGMSGEIKIGAPPFLCERLMEDVISDFLQLGPHISAELVPDYFPTLERKILLNQLDIAICPIKLVLAKRSELRVEPLFTDEHVIVCRQGHPLSAQPRIGIESLEAATWIGHPQHSMLRSDMATALASIGVTNLNFAFQSESSGAVFSLLQKTDFLTVLPRYALVRGYADRGLSVLPIAFESATLSVGMVTMADRLERPLLARFAAYLRATFSSQRPRETA